LEKVGAGSEEAARGRTGRAVQGGPERVRRKNKAWDIKGRVESGGKGTSTQQTRDYPGGKKGGPQTGK